MALAPVVLDDLDWKAMVEAIRRRIPAASDGAWTLHAPVDPGITLLELFAWQLEQRLYRMDQAPEALTRGLLALAGTRTRRTRCAHTVLQVVAGQATLVPRRTEFMLVGAEPPMVYSTRTPLAMLKPLPDGLRLWVGERERSNELRQGRVIRLLPREGEGEETRIELLLAQPPAAGDGQAWFGLSLQLRTATGIAPQWSPDAVAGVPPPTAVEWSYPAGGGRLKPFAVDDGTGGLRRSGVVRLRIPPDWQAEPGGAYAIHLRATAADFSAPPRLVALEPNAVIARHARATPLREERAEWLPLAGNVIRLDAHAADEADRGVPPLESACVLALRERDGQWHAWRAALSLHASGPTQRVFVVDRERAQLRFGDGLRGRLPVLSSEPGPNIRYRYVVGGGSAGTVGPSVRGAAAEPDWEAPGGIMARSLTASLGGGEAETLQQARDRTTAALRAPARAVTADDFVDLARSTPGVAVRRAHAAIGRHPGQPCLAVPGAVTVYVLPDAPREDVDPELVEDAFVPAPQPDAGLLAAVRARLDAARLLTTELFVSAPTYRAIGLRAVLQGDVHDPAQLREVVRERLQRFLDPLVGGDDADGWPFGEPVRASVMLREVQAAAGRQARVLEVAIGIDGGEPAERCRAIEIGPHELVWLQGLDLRFQRGATAVEGLR
jgi:hypothetical protein